MITANLDEIEKQGIRLIDLLTDNKRQALRKEMIKFAKESFWTDSSDYGLIIEFINDFFMQSPLIEDEFGNLGVNK